MYTTRHSATTGKISTLYFVKDGFHKEDRVINGKKNFNFYFLIVKNVLIFCITFFYVDKRHPKNWCHWRHIRQQTCHLYNFKKFKLFFVRIRSLFKKTKITLEIHKSFCFSLILRRKCYNLVIKTFQFESRLTFGHSQLTSKGKKSELMTLLQYMNKKQRCITGRFRTTALTHIPYVQGSSIQNEQMLQVDINGEEERGREK